MDANEIKLFAAQVVDQMSDSDRDGFERDEWEEGLGNMVDTVEDREALLDAVEALLAVTVDISAANLHAFYGVPLEGWGDGSTMLRVSAGLCCLAEGCDSGDLSDLAPNVEQLLELEALQSA